MSTANILVENGGGNPGSLSVTGVSSSAAWLSVNPSGDVDEQGMGTYTLTVNRSSLPDGTYSGTLSIKLGPMAATFEGQATVTPDAAAKSGRIEGKGADRRGGSRGQVRVDYVLEAAGAGTKVLIDADVTLSGAAAQFGRTGLINEMSNRLIGDFVGCVEGKLAASSPEEASDVRSSEVNGLTLFFQSLVAWLRRILGR